MVIPFLSPWATTQCRLMHKRPYSHWCFIKEYVSGESLERSVKGNNLASGTLIIIPAGVMGKKYTHLHMYMHSIGISEWRNVRNYFILLEQI